MSTTMTLPKKPIRNPIAVGMNLRFGRTTTVMKDKRTKRKNRNSWRKEEEGC